MLVLTSPFAKTYFVSISICHLSFGWSIYVLKYLCPKSERNEPNRKSCIFYFHSWKMGTKTKSVEFIFLYGSSFKSSRLNDKIDLESLPSEMNWVISCTNLRSCLAGKHKHTHVTVTSHDTAGTILLQWVMRLIVSCISTSLVNGIECGLINGSNIPPSLSAVFLVGSHPSMPDKTEMSWHEFQNI